MTRRSRRELEHALDDLAEDGGDDLPDQYVINRRVVNAEGEVIDTRRRSLSYDPSKRAKERKSEATERFWKHFQEANLKQNNRGGNVSTSDDEGKARDKAAEE